MLLRRPALKSLYPPRAEVTVNPARLSRYRGKYVGQFKYNDVRTLIYIFPHGKIELLTRRRVPHRAYRLSSRMKSALRALDLSPRHAHVLDGGIMRYLSVRGERPIVLWDILVHDDEYLLGSTYLDRYALLKEICGNPENSEKVTGLSIGLTIAPALWLAPTFKSRFFEEKYGQAVRADFLEGLMLKDPKGKLERGLLERNNTSWQVKARKPRKDYLF